MRKQTHNIQLQNGEIMSETNYGAQLLRHIQTTEMCFECGREFDLFNEEEANEYINGHDCEE